MPDIPEGAKRPSDRKAKQVDPDECFSFEHDGETYTLKPTHEVLTPGFIRKNRRRTEDDAFFTMLEALIPDYDDDGNSKTLDVLDNMTRGQFQILTKDFYAYLEVSGQGE